MIPEVYPCYFIRNVVNQIDCSKANPEFYDKSGKHDYPREMLLLTGLMSVFDEKLSYRKIERITRTDIDYMCLIVIKSHFTELFCDLKLII